MNTNNTGKRNIIIEETAKVKSISDLISLLKKQYNYKRKTGDFIFYRGEAQNYGNTKLLPKIMRPDEQEKEYSYYYDMITNFPQEFEKLTNLSRLAKMQHYSCPTRLLDLTRNPLVALYFACCDKKGEGRFYVFETEKILNYDSDRALLLSCLSHLNNVQQEAVKDFIVKFKSNKTVYDKNKGCFTNEYIEEMLETNSNTNTDDNGAFQFERLIGEVMRERPAFMKYKTFADDLLTNYIVSPLIQNERQKKQDGIFLIFGLDGVTKTEDKVEYNDCIKRKSYVVKNKESILRELDLLGINESTLFVDMESRVKYLDYELQLLKSTDSKEKNK